MAVINLSDPNAPDLFGDYFFELNNRSREAMLAKKEMKVVDGGSSAAASILDGCTFSIGVKNYPEDDISLESVTFLTTTYHSLRSVLSVPPPPITDRREAAVTVDWSAAAAGASASRPRWSSASYVNFNSPSSICYTTRH